MERPEDQRRMIQAPTTVRKKKTTEEQQDRLDMEVQTKVRRET